ncbi:acyltransferase family protein [Butyrivibrio sp. VCB2001]|uniref:acyltransferase family protein n=1 Tax=Butyrivibrio sp. VCB2001 TaxID=1280667 RepID=UPI00041CFA80|nr:acyltransferase [Butyrivibrio sp. VCB2001]
MSTLGKREIWVDNVKVIACILVVLGHFFQSMVKAGLMQNSCLYNWFNSTIYTFHVPLFFICSGYLFQKYSQIDSGKAWGNNVLKKFIALGVPYFVFSTATWLLKKVFSSSVNTELGSLPGTLFVQPTAPYWYLYILFFIFLITITARNHKTMIIFIIVSAFCKLAVIAGFQTGIYCIDNTMSNWIWFILGMACAYGMIKLANSIVGIILLIIFILGSVLLFAKNICFAGEEFVLGLIVCYSILCIIFNLYKDGKQNRIFGFAARYTMPVFLMHTIFAAPLRSVLIKAGITNLAVHIVAGIVISFAGPIVAMIVMEKLKPLDFVVYPMKYIRFSKKAC